MRKFWIGLVFALAVFCGGQPVHAAQNQYVYDHAGVLSAKTRSLIKRVNTVDFAKLPGHPVLVVEIYRRIPGDADTADYKVRRFEQLGIGHKDWDNGLYFVMATQSHKYGLATGYGLESALPDAEAENIVTAGVKTTLRAGDYDAAVAAIVQNIRQRLVANRKAIMAPADIQAKQAATRRNHLLLGLAAVILASLPALLFWRHRWRTKRLRAAVNASVRQQLPLYRGLTKSQRAAYRRHLSAPWWGRYPQPLAAWVQADFMAYVQAQLGWLVTNSQVTAPEPTYVYGNLPADALDGYADAGSQVANLDAYLQLIEPAVAATLSPVRAYLPAFSDWAQDVNWRDQQAVWAAFANGVGPADAAILAAPEAQKRVFAAILAHLQGADDSGADWALMPLWVATDYGPITDSSDDHDDFGSGGGFGGGDTGGGGFDGGW